MAIQQRRVARHGHAQNQTKDGPRNEDVAVAAYYIAERRGFAGDQQLDDWLSAERELGAQPETTGDDDRAARGMVEEDIEPDEVHRWAQKFGISAEELRVAMQRVGPSSVAVQKFLRSGK